MNRILVDTNVLVYSIDKDSTFYARSRELFNQEEFSLYTTIKNISEFIAVVTRPPLEPLTTNNALEVIESFQTFMTILYPNPSSFSLFCDLLKKYKPTGLRIHDLKIASIGLSFHIKHIATFNKKDLEYLNDIQFVSL